MIASGHSSQKNAAQCEVTLNFCIPHIACASAASLEHRFVVLPLRIDSRRTSPSEVRSSYASLFGARELHDPVRFPALPCVERIGLFPARGCRCNPRPGQPLTRRLPPDGRIAVESAAAVFEPILDWWIEIAVRSASVKPPD